MRAVLWLLALAALAAADRWEEPWVEQDHGEEPYSEERDDDTPEAEPGRVRRELSGEEEHAAYEQSCCDREVYRTRRDAEYVRAPRQVHQYEVHEEPEEAEAAQPAPPYEEMLAASADHYHRVYAPPAPAHYLNPDVSAGPAPRLRPALQFAPVNVPRTIAIAEPPQKLVLVPSQNSQNHASHVNVAINHSVPAYQPVSVPVPSHPQSSVVRNPVQFVSPGVVPPAPPLPGAAQQPADEASVSRLAEGDLLGAPAGHAHQHQQHHKHAHGHSAGGGNSKHAAHHAAHGGKSLKGFDSHQHSGKGSKGQKLDEHHRKEYEEATGKKKKHHDHAGHKGGHQEEAHGHRGAHFDEKKGHKKGHKTKGYHNKYHKDEFHKEHKFYDDFHKSGDHHRYGKFHAKHASNESGKKKAHHVNAGHDFVERGKKGYSNKGHMDADHKGYKGKHGHEEHHESHKNHGKKGGGEGGKEWGYSKKN